jgi:hypothetical protein
MSRGQEILVMTVNITETRKDKIIVHEFDQPELLAKDFVYKYNLNPKLVDVLASEIIFNINDLRPVPALPKSSPIEFHGKSELSEGQNVGNYGEKLYMKGLKRIERTEHAKLVLKNQIHEENDKELTFKPKINPVSELIAQRMANRSQDSVRRKESAIAKFQLEKNAEELDACTFAPKINPNSSKILQNKYRSGSSRFVELYEDSYVRKVKQEHLEKQVEFPFRPEILQRHNVSSSGDRLYCKKQMDESKASASDLFDPETGQEFFVPKINQTNYTRYRDLPIGEHLYRQKKSQTDLPECLTSNPTFEAKNRTERLIKLSKNRRFREIFDQLNPDEHDIISYKRINAKFVEPLAYKLMQPLLDELKEEEETLDFEQYSNSMDNLLKILAPDERDVFLISKRNKEDLSQTSVGKKSITATEATGVYNRQIEKRLGNQARLELEREKKVRNELHGCTFHPQTTPYSRSMKRIDIE